VPDLGRDLALAVDPADGFDRQHCGQCGATRRLAGKRQPDGRSRQD
jgi:hypothetical protein